MIKSLKLLLVVCLSLFLFAHISSAEASHTSFFNSQWLKAVVSIGIPKSGNQQAYHHIGTGFLVQSSRSHFLLCTAKHVYDDAAKRNLQGNLVYTATSNEGIVSVPESDLEGRGIGGWFLSQSADVACRFMAFPGSHSPFVIPASALMSNGELEPGAPLLVLGFPYGEPKNGLTHAIVRHGTFAGTDDRGNLIADALVFPGNSGAPVVYVPPFRVSAPLQSSLVSDEKLVGLVVSYTPVLAPTESYVETVVLENSGLANLVSAKEIKQLIARQDVNKLDAALPAKPQ